MPLAEDPAHKDWAWFPRGSGKDFTFTKCLDPLEPLRDELTVLAGFSHPSVRSIHGHSNADQFLTGAATGPTGDYKNSISLDQEFAAHVGDQTRFASLVRPMEARELRVVRTPRRSIEVVGPSQQSIGRSESSTCCL